MDKVLSGVIKIDEDLKGEKIRPILNLTQPLSIFQELERRRMEQGGASGVAPGGGGPGMQAGGVHLTDVPSRTRRVTSAIMTPWDRRAETE